jgi:hypothetical protein
MKTLTRDQILEVHDCEAVKEEVPEWGGAVFVKMMNGIERGGFVSIMGSYSDESGDVDCERGLKSQLLARTLCDENDELIFTEEDVEALRLKNGAVIHRLFMVAKKLNGIGDSEEEEEEKNSSTGPEGKS